MAGNDLEGFGSLKAKTKKHKQKETTTMKTKLTKTIMSSLLFTCALGCLVAAMALGTSGTARATARFPQSCSVQTLNGLYLWAWDGYQNFGGNPVPKTIMQGIQFNGDGTFTNTFGTINIGGTIVRDVTGGVGTYTVAADCTGTLSSTGPSFNMYVGPGAQQLWTTQTWGGPGDGTGLGVGTATRVP
jgi:hypothetical protein